MRTQEEIKQKINEWKEADFFGFRTSELLGFLSYEFAKEFLKSDTVSEEWDKLISIPSEKNVKEKMIDYMEFAWGKANNFRGISAARSMSHYMAWVWLLGDEAVNHFGDLEDYEYYGKDNLVKLCEYLKLDSSKWDDGIRQNEE